VLALALVFGGDIRMGNLFVRRDFVYSGILKSFWWGQLRKESGPIKEHDRFHDRLYFCRTFKTKS